jgi:hypothetical protein
MAAKLNCIGFASHWVDRAAVNLPIQRLVSPIACPSIDDRSAPPAVAIQGQIKICGITDVNHLPNNSFLTFYLSMLRYSCLILGHRDLTPLLLVYCGSHK